MHIVLLIFNVVDASHKRLSLSAKAFVFNFFNSLNSLNFHNMNYFCTMEQLEKDTFYMRRCLQLAANGLLNAKPNPMVGAVIVAPDGRIIGEGYHVRCGEGHAEVNAFASVKPEDEALLAEATMYVSLEPCSHYGRTPPCADLIIRKGVRRVVVGCIDPFAKVQGRGIKKLTDAGVDVTIGVLERECMELNERFFTYNEGRRPYVLVKWCQTNRGCIDNEGKPTMLSTPFTQMLSHKLRAEYDAILVGRVTAERDRPRLNVRHWSGPDPMRLTIDRNRPFDPSADFSRPVVPQVLKYLYDKGVQSLIVEGGAKTIQGFFDYPFSWDEIRVETSMRNDFLFGTSAPELPENVRFVRSEKYGDNEIRWYKNALIEHIGYNPESYAVKQ